MVIQDSLDADVTRMSWCMTSLRQTDTPMGTFFVNFHARSHDLNAIAQALGRVSSVEALVAEPRPPWTSFFDRSASAQDTKEVSRIARSVSKKLNTAVFGFLVHDSDVFQYHLYDRGALVDRYDSRPDYFGRISEATCRKWAGRADLLMPWAQAGVTVEDIRVVLSRDASFSLEEERAVAFATLFGIDAGLAAMDFRDLDGADEGFLSVLSKANPAARALTRAVQVQDVAAVRAKRQ